MLPAIQNLYVVYGSVSGNAKELACQLSSDRELAQKFDIKIRELDELELSDLNELSFVAFVSSSFGDGEPPGNAEKFWQKFQENSEPVAFSYGVFGLGDTAYPNFCGFSKSLDHALDALGAKRLINRVDSDLNYSSLFNIWKTALKAVLIHHDEQAGQDLDISVTSYGEHTAYRAELLSFSKISGTFPSLFQAQLSIENSGIQYQPGDIVHLIPYNTEPLLTPFVSHFNVPINTINTWLKDKEIARISKSTIRKMTQIFPNSDLKALLKHKNKAILVQYLKRHQLIDLLRDFYPPQAISIQELADNLSTIEPRTYSIASSQSSNGKTLDICVREVWSDPDNLDPRPGCSTAFLQSLAVGDSVPIFVRSNPSFHFDLNAPSILIATGAGIAPFIGYLQLMAQQKSSPPCLLFYGEKHRDKDFVYQDEIRDWLKSGVIQHYFGAFSRDNNPKRYVQDLVKENGSTVKTLIEQGANVYICGRKQNLANQVEPMLNGLLTSNGEEKTEVDLYNQLLAEGKLHTDLF